MEKYLRFFRKQKAEAEITAETTSVLFDRSERYSALLYSLAEGLNPITGEDFPEGTIDQPEIIRALYAGAAALSGKSAGTIRSKRNPNAGEKWSAEDDRLLMAEYNDGASIKELAKKLGRSELAIHMRIDKQLTNEIRKNNRTESQNDNRIREAMQNRKIR